MRILLDSNILLRVSDYTHLHHAAAIHALKQLGADVMEAEGITDVLTFNLRDFARYATINALDSASVGDVP